MSFEIIFGGEDSNNIQSSPANDLPEPKHVEDQIRNNNTVLTNWNKCLHRSNKMEYIKPSCCGRANEKVVGYQCFKLGILDLSPLICERCNFAEHKPETQENN